MDITCLRTAKARHDYLEYELSTGSLIQSAYSDARVGLAQDRATKHLCPWRKDFVLGLRTDFHYGFNRLPSTFFQRSVRARMALDPAHNPLEGGVKGAVLAGSPSHPRSHTTIRAVLPQRICFLLLSDAHRHGR